MRPAFFDTNVFLYADDRSSGAKRNRALELIATHHSAGLAIVSIQVLQEYFAAATRKLGVDPSLAQQKVEIMARMRVVRPVEDDVIAAIELHRLHGVSFWDAMILHAARTAGAEVLYSEDLQTGRAWGGLTVVNPFQE